MKITLIPPADKELHEAIDYYNDQLAGLGDQFFNSFLDTVGYISQTPEVWKKIGPNTRRINIKRFPYLILHVFDNQDIFITCIAHQHRNPTFYLERAD
ncbi:MAG: type II toxin-antitoxin system RelE/ParE family toxin [Proteobacteria bacterium]|nr:type II toxin-antitoxin system RelE/ParE family toxin [Pseudomonadota bacterium]MBU1585955.1 type II toxin-antitoxin system RelE/ParE family toxin [Pseudomonadota bacterium]MBU2452215.1 type II toxin-antitoxin system RelE/ParE family toxin [Pseudomonadota bacterium]MBU2628227.1 type II toxin-antitoxin system RelE/ParE family toxin [Pseudomonadota bacterium]